MSRRESAGEPRWLTEAMLLGIHARQIERYGGAHGVRDIAVLRSALARPRNAYAYRENVDLADLAASYLVGLARSQAFVDGNKRAALAGALVFLALNGRAIHVPPGELFALTMKAATSEIGDAPAAEYIRSRAVDAWP